MAVLSKIRQRSFFLIVIIALALFFDPNPFKKSHEKILNFIEKRLQS